MVRAGDYPGEWRFLAFCWGRGRGLSSQDELPEYARPPSNEPECRSAIQWLEKMEGRMRFRSFQPFS